MSNFKRLKLTAGYFAMLFIAASVGQAEEISNKSLGSNSKVEHSADKKLDNGSHNNNVAALPEGQITTEYCENCDSGRRLRRGRNGYRQGRCPNCRSGNCRGRCHHSPVHGWRVPGHNPVERQNFEYTKYWPNYWSGYGPGSPVQAHPVVYTPTDTTQLGYYYNHVPQWRPIPGMLPQAPVPSQYHDRSITYNHRNHFWGNYDEDHKWRHRVQYSKAASGHREPIPYSYYHNRGGHNDGYHNNGAIHSTCPTCQPQISGNYPTPVANGKGNVEPKPIPEPTMTGK